MIFKLRFFVLSFYTRYMPTKLKKKRANFKAPEEEKNDTDTPPVRQIVEVVSDTVPVPEAIETIKKDTEEIKEAVEEIEEHIEEDHAQAPELHEESEDDTSSKEIDHRSVVASLFAKEQPVEVAPEITVIDPQKKSFAVWVGLMLGIVSAVGVGLLLFVKGPQHFSNLLAKPTPTNTPTLAPTPTTLSVNRKDIHIRVVNGGGTAGAAGKMKSFLENLGYSVDSVGNSTDYTFTTTEISVKSGHDSITTLLKSDLGSEYTLGSSSADLADSADYDALVTVGK
jgi:hypothetical protein